MRRIWTAAGIGAVIIVLPSIRGDENMNLKERAKKLKREIPALFLALKDEDTPLMAKILAAITVAYALSPIDLIPDVIPVLGYLDDVILLPMLAALTVRLIPEDVMERNRQQAEGMWSDGKPKRWYYAIPIVLIWVVVIAWIGKAALSSFGSGTVGDW